MTSERSHIHKVIEIVGTSGESVDDAIRTAVTRAGETLRGLEWFEVKEVRGRIADGEVDQFQVTLGIGFRVLDPAQLRDEAAP